MLPTFIIIGTMKGGTTSLHHYLDLHPEIIMSKVKETNFFLEDNYRKGIKWYEAHFIGQAKAYGETSPNYSKYPTFAGIPQRMYSVAPEAKLIYILRDPIDRIISHYMHKCRTDGEKRSIAEVLFNLDDNHYVAVSQYYRQLEQYLNYYSREKILILTAEELRTQPQATLKTIFNFLDVDDSFYSPEYARKFNQSSGKRRKNKISQYLSKMRLKKWIRPFVPSTFIQVFKQVTERPIERPELDQALEEKLVEYLKEDVDSLRKYTGNEFKGWRL